MSPFEILIPLAGILVAGLIFLIPIAGLTARFALKPMMEAFTQVRASKGSEDRVAYLEQRLALVEEQFHALEREQQRLSEESEFRRQLEAPKL